MNKLLVIILIAFGSLATNKPGKLAAASGGGFWWHLIQREQKTVDFDKLDQWMWANLLPDDDVRTSLAFVEDNLHQLHEPQVRRAAEVLLEIGQMNKCDDHMLANLRELPHEKRIFLLNKRRIDRVLLSSLARLTDLCGHYIDQQVASLHAHQLTNQLERFLQVVLVGMEEANGWQVSALNEERNKTRSQAKHSETFFHYIGDLNDDSMKPTIGAWARYLFELAHEDPKAQVNKRVAIGGTSSRLERPRREPFDYAFNRYILDACRELTRVFGPTLEAEYGLAEIQCARSKGYKDILATRSPTMLALMYANKVCRASQNLGTYMMGGDINQIYDHYIMHEVAMRKRSAVNG